MTWCALHLNGRSGPRVRDVFNPNTVIQGPCETVFTLYPGSPIEGRKEKAVENPKLLKLYFGPMGKLTRQNGEQ